MFRVFYGLLRFEVMARGNVLKHHLSEGMCAGMLQQPSRVADTWQQPVTRSRCVSKFTCAGAHRLKVDSSHEMYSVGRHEYEAVMYRWSTGICYA